MKKSRVEMQREEIAKGEKGELVYFADPSWIDVADEKTFQAGVDRILADNVINVKYKDQRKGKATRIEDKTSIRVSKSTYMRLSKKAKRAHMNVSEFLEKLAGEK